MSDDWYKRDVRAALKGMATLTLEERGAYNTIIDYLYLLDGPLDDDDSYIAGLLRCHANKWKAIKSALVAKGRLRVEAGKVDDDRAVVERQARHHIKTERTQAGHKGGIASGKSRKSAVETEANASQPSNQIREDKKREEKSVPKGTHTRAIPIPPDWQPPPENLAWAKAKGFPQDFIERETERHQLWAEARGITRKDWGKSWQNWLLRTWSEGGHQRGTGPPGGNPIRDAIDRVRAKARDTENDSGSGEIFEFAARRC